MKRLQVENFGPIRTADVEFGDLTVLVGPQASGKSLFVQLYKAIEDAGAIRADLRNYGFEWLRGKDPVSDYCGLYFGGGLQGLIESGTVARRDGKPLGFEKIAKPPGRAAAQETVFLVPAQRVLVLQDGWPKPFMAYSAGDPYCMRRFSDSLRLLMENGMGGGRALFPHTKRLKSELKSLLDGSIYVGGRLVLESEGLRKRIMLAPSKEAPTLPYNAWSAGQREFTPLLLAAYWLMPGSGATRREALDAVVIEEPEMGLHPQAIVGFGLLVLELLHRKYRVIVSTHSPVVLDLVWAIRELAQVRKEAAVGALRQIFHLGRLSDPMKDVLHTALAKEYRTYLFNRAEGGVVVRDISALDPGDEDPNVAGWGGLSGFSGHIAETVGKTLAAERG